MRRHTDHIARRRRRRARQRAMRDFALLGVLAAIATIWCGSFILFFTP